MDQAVEGSESAGGLNGNWEEVPLSALFEEAEKIHSASDTSSGAAQVERGCRILSECIKRIEALALFSANEEIDDVTTRDMKYILAPFLLGDLMQRRLSEDRLKQLKLSQAYMAAFVGMCDRLKLVPAGEREVFMREAAPDPATRRAEKIARFQRQRALDSQMIALQQRREETATRRRSLKATSGRSEEEDDAEDLDSIADEQHERQMWLLKVSLALGKALDLLDAMKREEEVLEAAAKAAGESADGKMRMEGAFSRMSLDERLSMVEARHRAATQGTQAASARRVAAAQPITCARFAQDVIEGRSSVKDPHHHKPLIFGPVSMTGQGSYLTDRQQKTVEVFQPSHSLPSMSIEEAGLREMKMMEAWQERAKQQIADGAAVAGSRPKVPDEESDEEEEMKKRRWDDWKDENQRGAGNSKITPCG